MTDLLEVLIGANVNDNLVVMVDNQSILREIRRWVGEGGRTFLALSANPDILWMIIGRLCMRITQGTVTFLHRNDVEVSNSCPTSVRARILSRAWKS